MAEKTNPPPWDAAILAKLRSEPYASMRQGDIEDRGLTDAGQIGDDKIADLINAETVDLPDSFADVPTETIVHYLTLARRLFGLKKAATSLEPADSLVHLLDSTSVVRTSDQTVRDQFQGILTDLVKASLLDQKSTDDIEAMYTTRNRKMPWWESIGATSPLCRFDFHRARLPQ